MKKLIIKFFAYCVLIGFKLSEKSKWFNEKIFKPLYMFFVKWAVRAWKKGGEEAWESFHKPLWYESGRVRSEYLRKKMNMNPNDARSMGSYQDYEDPKLGITGHWEVLSEDYAVKIETECEVGRYLYSQNCPAVCRNLVVMLELGTVEGISSGYYFDIGEGIISEGCDTCRVNHYITK